MGRNVTVRREQYKATADPNRALSISKRFVAGKIKNCRTLLRRNCPDCDTGVLDKMSEYVDKAMSANNMATLLGIEGAAASLYLETLGPCSAALPDSISQLGTDVLLKIL